MTKKNEKKSNQYLWRHQCHRRRKGEGGPGTRAEVTLQPLGEDCGGAGCPPCSPWSSAVEQRSVCSPWRSDPMLKQVDTSGGRCSMWRNHGGADFLAGAAAQNSCWSSLFLKDRASWKGAWLEQFMKYCVLWKGLGVAAGEQCEKEGVAARSCYGQMQTPFSIFLCHLRERGTEVRGEGLKLNMGRRGRGKCF